MKNFSWSSEDVSIRGFPTKLSSDNDPQLVAANEELKNVFKGWNQEELKTFGVMKGFNKWDFAPADAPWEKGVLKHWLSP